MHLEKRYLPSKFLLAFLLASIFLQDKCYATSTPQSNVPAPINSPSAYSLNQLDETKRMSESDPNMLAKLFDYPTNVEVEYPETVWQFLNSVPAEDTVGKTRRELLISL